MVQDENGRKVYDTKKYYQDLDKNHKGLVKAFFKKENIDEIDTNYIGHLAEDAEGRNTRVFDKVFEEKYKIDLLYKDRSQNKVENTNGNSDLVLNFSSRNLCRDYF